MISTLLLTTDVFPDFYFYFFGGEPLLVGLRGTPTGKPKKIIHFLGVPPAQLATGAPCYLAQWHPAQPAIDIRSALFLVSFLRAIHGNLDEFGNEFLFSLVAFLRACGIHSEAGSFIPKRLGAESRSLAIAVEAAAEVHCRLWRWLVASFLRDGFRWRS